MAVVLGQKQLYIDPSGLPYFGAGGEYFHSLFYHIVTGGHQPVHAAQFHHAHPAGADLIDPPEITQAGDVDARRAGRIQNGGAFGHSHRNMVYGEIYHCLILPPLNTP